MIVISDTTCISTLLQIGAMDLLYKQFNEIIIPPKVLEELTELSNFGHDISGLYKALWLHVKTPTASPLLSLLNHTLDQGEAEAIALAVELNADLLIIDEKKGRSVAKSMEIPFTGLGGILIRAKQAGLIDKVEKILDTIAEKTGFHLSKNARLVILNAAGEI